MGDGFSSPRDQLLIALREDLIGNSPGRGMSPPADLVYDFRGRTAHIPFRRNGLLRVQGVRLEKLRRWSHSS
jgi:hypothetical protein